MKLRQSLKNSVRYGLLVSILVSGCILEYQPTYKKETLPQAIQEICQKEYNLSVKAKLIDSTLWIYLPLENITEVPKKPKKYIEKFKIHMNFGLYEDKTFKFLYGIEPIPTQEKKQEKKIADSAIEKMRKLLRVIQRVIFSMEKLKKGELEFVCLNVVDVKSGILIEEIFYIEDLKKLYYGIISTEEAQHRMPLENYSRPDLIGDWEGNNLSYQPLKWEDFILAQIRHRINLKFETPEVKKENVDIDKEIIKIISYTLKIYDFKNFSTVELFNLLTQNKIVLNQNAILTKIME